MEQAPTDIAAARKSKFPTQEEIDAAVGAGPGNDDPDLTARDADVAAAAARAGGGKKDKGKKAEASASPQNTLDVVKPSPTALRIMRAWLAARDVNKKVAAFKKQLMANLDKQMQADKVDFLECDGVRFNRLRVSEVAVGAFDDWTPNEDSTEALLKLLGVTADDLKAATGDDGAGKS